MLPSDSSPPSPKNFDLDGMVTPTLSDARQTELSRANRLFDKYIAKEIGNEPSEETDGLTVLSWVVKNLSVEKVTRVLMKSSLTDVITRDSDGKNPVFHALMRGDVAILQSLVNCIAEDIANELRGFLYCKMPPSEDTPISYIMANGARAKHADVLSCVYSAEEGRGEILELNETGIANVEMSEVIKDLISGKPKKSVLGKFLSKLTGSAIRDGGARGDDGARGGGGGSAGAGGPSAV